jgi:beta-glucosidase
VTSDDLGDEQKVTLLSGRSEWWLEPVAELDLPSVMVTDGPHGLRKVMGEGALDLGASESATCFPTAAGLGSTWDRELVAEIGRAIAHEARAQDVAVVLGPGINIKRHPLCGRNFEYFSEDPLLAGELAASYISAVQSLGVGTSLKHFAVNNQESNRMVVDAIVDERTLRELYLPAFETAVNRAQPWTVMSAYNLVNGEYCSEHPWLLDTVLRREWGFEGLVISDWGGNNDRVAGLVAGLDIEMPGGARAHDATVLAALTDGTLPRDALDRSVARITDLLRRVAATAATPKPAYTTDEHHALARRAAAESAVLLTHDRTTLPLDPSATIAVIGDFARSPRYQGGGSSRVNPTRLDTALSEITAISEKAGGRVDFAAGYDATSGLSQELVDEAVAVAGDAEVAVLFIGLPGSWETEGADRTTLDLPEQHDRLVEAVCAANPSTVVVVSAGGAVAMPWAQRPAAVIHGHLGGQASGGGIADVLYGRRDPGGRLAETFPLQVTDVPSDQWFPGEPRQVQYREGLYVGYRWFDTVDAPVLFPFGHGLSYTSFEITDATLTAESWAAGSDEPLALSVDVRNTGDRPGSEVVQVYVRAVDAPVYRPDRELRAFEKVRLAPGETRTVTCTLGPRAFAHWDCGSGAWQVAGGRYEVLVGTSSRAIHAVLPVEVSSDAPAPAGTPDGPYTHPTSEGWTVDEEAFAALLGHPVARPLTGRPFHRNSTLGDLATTRLGGPLVALLRKVAQRKVRGADAEGGLGVMIDRALVELPLRNLAAMTGGAVSMRTVDRIIGLANLLTRKRKRAD